jgi:hypothetical protein
MKSLRSHLITRAGLLVVLVSSAITTAVAAPVVTVNLTGATFGNNLDVHVNSGAQRIAAARSYGYEIEGTVHGTDLLAPLVPPGTDLTDLIESIQTGGSSFLSGKQANPTGTLPFRVINRTYSGEVPTPVPGVSASASVTLLGKITATGLVRFDVTNVNISLLNFTEVGTIVFEPGSKLTVSVSPVIEFKNAAATVSEDAGSVSLIVKRRFNSSGAVTVNFTTVAGTATLADYELTSGTLTFADGETQKMIVVPITNRAGAQGNRTFKVKLSAPGGDAILGVKRKEFVTITDAP